MDLKQNPFSLYDFLGYFVPGSITIYLLIIILNPSPIESLSFDNIKELFQFSKSELYIPFVIFAYMVGHLISFVSSITIEKYAQWTYGYPSKYLIGIHVNKYWSVKGSKRKIVRFILAVSILPISILDWLLGIKIGFRALHGKKLDELLVVTIKKAIINIMSEEIKIKDASRLGDPSESDYFRYMYHYALEHAENHINKMQNYVALYGFLRTVAFVWVIIFWLSVGHFCKVYECNIFTMSLICCSLAFSYTFYLAFIKFYRKYSLEALMAAAVANNSKDKFSKSKLEHHSIEEKK